MFLQEARDRTAALPNKGYHAFALGGVAEGLYDAGHIDEALQALDSIGIIENSDSDMSNITVAAIRLGFYSFMAKQEAADRHFENSWRVTEAERKADDFPAWDDLTELLLAMAASGLPGDSRTIIARVQKGMASTSDDKIYPTFRAGLGSALLVAGDAAGAEAQFATVRRAAANQVNIDLRDYDLESLARAYAAAGKIAEGLDLIEQSFPPATSGPAYIKHFGALRYVAMAAVQTGKPSDAIRIAERSASGELRDIVIHAIAVVSANQGNYDDAERWARKIGSHRDVEQSLADIAARAACVSSSSARWIVVFREESLDWRFPQAVGPGESRPFC